MSIASDALANRAFGQLPLSIATSLAIEAAVGIHPDYPVNSPPILKYDELWINILTLFRNVVGSVDNSISDSLSANAIADTIESEMNFLEDIIKEYTNGKVNIVFFYSDYKNIELHYKKGVVRMDNTEKQKAFTKLRNGAVGLVLARQKEAKLHRMHICALEIKLNSAIKNKVLMLTHIAFDLLSMNEFDKLTLLESHTGKLKEKAQWYTKFIDGNALSNIPFTHYFIQIFGDKEIFRPMAIQLRKDIMEVATKYNWSSISTSAKIRYGIESMKNEYAKQIVLSMM